MGHTNTPTAGGNTLARDLIVDADKKQKLIEGHNEVWYRFKKTLLDHVSCGSRKCGGDQHYQGIIAKKHRIARRNGIMGVTTNLLKCCLIVVKIKSAALHYEDLVSLLQSTGSAVGNLGQGRKQVNGMVKAFQVYMYKKLHQILTTPLANTGLPPHFATTSDKSTPIKVSNHAIMILTVVDGKKCAIPICAPKVYEFGENAITGGTAPHLAEQVIDSLKKNVKLTDDDLSYLVAHQADGQYQAREFLSTLKDLVNDVAPLSSDKYFVVPWDPAHWLDLIIGDIREKEENGEILKRLVKRVNKFHHMFGSGRGHDEYQGFTKENELPSYKTKNFSTTRFASSSFECFQKTYDNYEGLVKTYNTFRETADEEEEMRYLIKGRDFIIDLCGMIDLLSPFMEMMVRVQAMDRMIWSITILMPRVKSRLMAAKEAINEQLQDMHSKTLSLELFPKLSKDFENLNKDNAMLCVFKGVSLTEGWMVVGEEVVGSGKGKKTKMYEWKDRSPTNCLEEMSSFVDTLVQHLNNRMDQCVSEAARELGHCLYIPAIAFHLQGDSERLSAIQRVGLEKQGKQEFHDFYEYVCELPHVKEVVKADKNAMFLPQLADHAFSRFKTTIIDVIWKNLGDVRYLWFPPISDKDKNMKHLDVLTKFNIERQENELDDLYCFHYEDVLCVARFDERAAFRSFYTNEDLFESLGKEMCTALDVANGMSGSEAVVESFYSVMKSQIQPGGMNNETLVNRTVVDWCFPNPFRCQETIKEVGKMYLDGDKEYGLSKHQVPVFVDERGRALNKYMQGSKVLDRHARETIKTFALSEKDKI